MRAGHAIFGIEVERLVVPLAGDIDHRIQLRILRLVLLLFFLHMSFMIRYLQDASESGYDDV